MSQTDHIKLKTLVCILQSAVAVALVAEGFVVGTYLVFYI